MQNLKYYCRKRTEALTDKISSVKLVVYRILFEHIIVQSANKTSYDSLSNLTSYWNEIISCQRTIIHISLRHEGNV